MTQHGLSASQARTVSTTDLIVYNEIDAISREIVAQALLGNLQATINDGTSMTESTPTITVKSSGAGDFTPDNTAVFAGETVTFGPNDGDGVGLDQAVADINKANITGLTASTDGVEITLSYEPSQGSWTFVLTEGTGALAELGFTAGTETPADPASRDYYDVWTNLTDDRKLSLHMTQVTNYFQGLGYNIVQKLNVTTGNTFIWEVYW